MAMYLTRFSYTPETWARLTKNPEDRRMAASKYTRNFGLSGKRPYLMVDHTGRALKRSPAASLGVGGGFLA